MNVIRWTRSSGYGLGHYSIKDCHQANVDFHSLRKQQVTILFYLSWFKHDKSFVLVAIPTAIAAFYLPVTLMCLLYFRIYRETVKRRKELHLLQAQHHRSLSTTINLTTPSHSHARSTKMSTTIGATIAIEQDESISTDSRRSHGQMQSIRPDHRTQYLSFDHHQHRWRFPAIPCFFWNR
jgi:hypothetical protein